MMDVELLKAISNYGVGIICLATLIVLHVYNVKVTIPEATKLAASQIDKLVETFKRELDSERKQCHEDHERLFEALAVTTKAVAENQNTLIRILDHMRPKRHP